MFLILLIVIVIICLSISENFITCPLNTIESNGSCCQIGQIYALRNGCCDTSKYKITDDRKYCCKDSGYTIIGGKCCKKINNKLNCK